MSLLILSYQADVILVVTCAIRENAESKIWKRLELFKKIKQQRSRNLPPLRVGLLGMLRRNGQVDRWMDWISIECGCSKE